MAASGNRRLGSAWLGLCAALALHVTDEALHDFLSLYNANVIALRETWPWLPLPIFSFGRWLGGLVAALLALFALTPLAFRGARLLRALASPLALLMALNGLAHLGGSLWLGRILPGALSSPVLVAASVWLRVALRRAQPEVEPKG